MITNPSPPELKACPFCEGAGEATDTYAGIGSAFVTIRCTTSSCGASQSGLTLEAAAEKWNTRPTTPPPDNAELIERREDFLREVYGIAFDQGAESTIEQWHTEGNSYETLKSGPPTMPHKDCKNEGAYQFVEDMLPKLAALEALSQPRPDGDVVEKNYLELDCDELDRREMVERVARAIREAGGASNWEHALEVATAAVDASAIGRMRELLEIIVLNARLVPDPTMDGMTDCYAVPIDDIDAARAALKQEEA